ncbi:MAG: hypothetical protein HQ581_18510 [Planctomycetes bacterium]|nr:hypothetical protein [Planctomycetota bacterium]
MQPVRLKPQGKLQGAIHGLRPKHGPFHTHLEDARGNRLSRSVELD